MRTGVTCFNAESNEDGNASHSSARTCRVGARNVDSEGTWCGTRLQRRRVRSPPHRDSVHTRRRPRCSGFIAAADRSCSRAASIIPPGSGSEASEGARMRTGITRFDAESNEGGNASHSRARMRRVGARRVGSGGTRRGTRLQRRRVPSPPHRDGVHTRRRPSCSDSRDAADRRCARAASMIRPGSGSEASEGARMRTGITRFDAESNEGGSGTHSRARTSRVGARKVDSEGTRCGTRLQRRRVCSPPHRDGVHTRRRPSCSRSPAAADRSCSRAASMIPPRKWE